MLLSTGRCLYEISRQKIKPIWSMKIQKMDLQIKDAPMQNLVIRAIDAGACFILGNVAEDGYT